MKNISRYAERTKGATSLPTYPTRSHQQNLWLIRHGVCYVCVCTCGFWNARPVSDYRPVCFKEGGINQMPVGRVLHTWVCAVVTRATHHMHIDVWCGRTGLEIIAIDWWVGTEGKNNGENTKTACRSNTKKNCFPRKKNATWITRNGTCAQSCVQIVSRSY